MFLLKYLKIFKYVKIRSYERGLYFHDGAFEDLLPEGRYWFFDPLQPGQYAFWKNLAPFQLVQEDMREALLDVAGQDVITADKVTLRLNALVTYRVADPRQAVSAAEDVRQALYREAQLAVRAIVG